VSKAVIKSEVSLGEVDAWCETASEFHLELCKSMLCLSLGSQGLLKEILALLMKGQSVTL